MPDIDIIPYTEYSPLQPYNWQFDNLPLQSLSLRLLAVNNATDVNTDILIESIGTQGTLANRLNQSLNADGSLRSDAMNNAAHNIAFHTDGSISLTPSQISIIDPLGQYGLADNVSFVRMLAGERNKLALTADEASALRMRVLTESISTSYLFENETIELVDTSTVKWTIESPNKIKANMSFPAEVAHVHYYNLTPIHNNIVTPDYIHYKVTTASTPYIEDSLRIYVNGVRIYEDVSTTVPSLTFTAEPSTGTFYFNRAVASTDVIKIDFDASLIS